MKKIKEYLCNSSDPLELSILLTADTELRVGELCSLKKSDYRNNQLTIERSEHKGNLGTKEKPDYQYYIGNTKKNHNRTIELSETAKKILERLISLSDSNSEWLFPSRNPNKAEWERSYNFDKTIRRVCREINIPVRSMHKLRKTYSANLLAAGYPEKFVQKQLGHSDIKTTQKAYNYDIFDSTDKERAIRDFEVGKALLTPTWINKERAQAQINQGLELHYCLCRRPGSNRYEDRSSRDFKSRASANSATPAEYYADYCTIYSVNADSLTNQH